MPAYVLTTSEVRPHMTNLTICFLFVVSKAHKSIFFLVIVKLGSIRKTVLASNVTRKNETLNRIKSVTLIINFF